jgi:AbiV family abortive infection protein
MAALMNRQSIAQGACYALVHATHLLEDAAASYSHARASTALHLAVMAREELGRFKLLAQNHDAMHDGESLDAKEIAASLQSHKGKLSAGQSTVPVPLTAEQMAQWTTAIEHNDERMLAVISEQVRLRANELKPHQVSEWHQRRLKAQYVDLDPNTGTWSRPSEVTPSEAYSLIRTVLAEIANALIASHAVPWLHSALVQADIELPRMGPFTHRVFANLPAPDAQPFGAPEVLQRASPTSALG